MVEETTGAKVWVGTIEDVDVPEGMFNAVASRHVIEHAYHPTRFVQRAASFLKPGGFLYILTPNFNSLGRRSHHKDWHALDPPRHLNLLTPRSLRFVCESTGLLRVTSCRTLTRFHDEMQYVYTLRETGHFKGEYHLNFPQQLSARAFNWLENAGNRFFKWGEEIEVIAQRI